MFLKALLYCKIKAFTLIIKFVLSIENSTTAFNAAKLNKVVGIHAIMLFFRGRFVISKKNKKKKKKATVKKGLNFYYISISLKTPSTDTKCGFKKLNDVLDSLERLKWMKMTYLGGLLIIKYYSKVKNQKHGFNILDEKLIFLPKSSIFILDFKHIDRD